MEKDDKELPTTHLDHLDTERVPEQTRQAASHIDPAAERRLVWKLDLTLLPLIILLYILNFIDRTNLGNARAAGLERDLGLIGASIFFVVFILFELPANLCIKHFGTWLIPVSVVGFGLVTLCTAFVKNFTGFMLVRVFLAIAESVCLPGCSYVLTRFYRRHELVWRLSMFLVAASLLSGAFGGLLAAGFLSAAPIGTLTTWRAIFLCEGIMTVAIGIIAIFIFPSDITTTKLFNEEERALAINRILADMPAARTTKEKTRLGVMKTTINGVSATCALCYMLCNFIVQGITVFLPSIVNTLGSYTPVEVQYRVVPVYIVSFVLGTTVVYLALKTRSHTPWIIGTVPLSIIGYAMWISSTNSKVRYAGTFLNLAGVCCAAPLFLSLACTNAAPDTVRAAMPPFVTGVGALGSLVSVWIYLPKETSRGYPTGNRINLTAACLITFITILLLLYIKRENRQSARPASETGGSMRARKTSSNSVGAILRIV